MGFYFLRYHFSRKGYQIAQTNNFYLKATRLYEQSPSAPEHRKVPNGGCYIKRWLAWT